MGLDMYLRRMPRYGRCTAEDVQLVKDYLDFVDYCKEPNHKETTLKNWCGRDESELPPEDVIDFYSRFYGKDDDEISEEVGYWRKANAVHNWFVNRVQGGMDDCNYHVEVSAEDLEDLKGICQEILDRVKLVPGKVRNGVVFNKDGSETIQYIDGLVVDHPDVCDKLLPSTSGFFFGSTEYDQYYLDDLEETIRICDEVLKTTDFKTQMVYYRSSW